MNATRQQILAIGETLIRTRGYHGFSYKDIALPLEVKNAAIHYYFPNKADLGAAIVEQHLASFGASAGSWQSLSLVQQFENFLGIYRHSHDRSLACLLGSLSPAYDSLPQPIRQQLKALGQELLSWLASLLHAGKEQGVFRFQEPPETKAAMVVSNLLAALLLQKAVDPHFFETVCQAVRQSVLA